MERGVSVWRYPDPPPKKNNFIYTLLFSLFLVEGQELICTDILAKCQAFYTHDPSQYSQQLYKGAQAIHTLQKHNHHKTQSCFFLRESKEA